MPKGKHAKSLLSGRLIWALIISIILVMIIFGSVESWIYFRKNQEEIQQQSQHITQRISRAVIPSIWNIYKQSVQRQYSVEAASAILDSEISSPHIVAVLVYGNFGQLYMGRIKNTDGTVRQYQTLRDRAFLKSTDHHEEHPIRNKSITIGKVEVYFSSTLRNEHFKKGLLIKLLEMIVLTGLFILVLYFSVKKALHEPLSSLLLSQRTLETMSEAVIVTDAEKKIIDVNPAYCSITGYSRKEAIGNNPRITSSKHHSKEFYRTLWQSLECKGEWSGEMLDRRKSGEVFPVSMTINAVHGDDGSITNYVGVFSDITYQKADEEQLERLAYYDPLTQLPNRALFQERLLHDLTDAKRRKEPIALFFIDIDHFKHINDSYGHHAGDGLLIEISKRFKARLRESDTLARLGGDEFTMIAKNFHKDTDLGKLAKTLIDEARKPFKIADQSVYVGASVGIARFPDDGDDTEKLTKRADSAMYHAKEKGRNQFHFYAPEMDNISLEKLEMDRALHRAIKENEFELHYQPKLDLITGQLIGAESLIRWRQPNAVLVPPNEFIPACEDSGLIVELGKWIIQESCEQLVKWRESGYSDLVMAVNLSARQIKNDDLYDDVRQAINTTGINPKLLEMEITESMVLEDMDNSIDMLNRLKSLGLTIAMDDFGTGYSSLSYLKQLPIDTLKIDRSFICELPNDPDDTAIVSAILSLANELKLKVVAEGIEKEEQRDFLVGKGCRMGQGYVFSAPVPADVFHDKWLPKARTVSLVSSVKNRATK